MEWNGMEGRVRGRVCQLLYYLTTSDLLQSAVVILVHTLRDCLFETLLACWIFLVRLLIALV